MIDVSERAKPCLNESDSTLNQFSWYALWTRPRHEKFVRDRLTHQGIDPFLPVIYRISQWKDRKKKIEAPLFPGYCFARFAWENRLAVLSLPGVVQIIGINGSPKAIPDHEIDAVRKLISTSLPYETCPYLHHGMRVRIIRGPLEGVEGVLLRRGERNRVILSVHLIQQAASIEVNLTDITSV